MIFLAALVGDKKKIIEGQITITKVIPGPDDIQDKQACVRAIRDYARQVVKQDYGIDTKFYKYEVTVENRTASIEFKTPQGLVPVRDIQLSREGTQVLGSFEESDVTWC